MTLQGRRNHYNVKFLKGYGHSISVKDSKIILKNNYDQFSEPSIESWYIKNMPYEKIVLQGKGYISTDALALLSENNRNVILLDNHGKPITYLNPVMESLTATKNRIAQYDTFRNPEKCQYLQRMIVNAKLESQIRFLKLTERCEVTDAISKLESQIRFLKSTENEVVTNGIIQLEGYLKQIENHSISPLKIEAPSSHVYFRNFAKLIPEKYEFNSRSTSVVRITKRNATDVINALLNYGYAVLAGEVSKFVNGFGLDAYCGFYHKSHTGFQPLVYDLMEPFRWLVDHAVFQIAINKDHGQRIRLKDYVHTKDGTVVMDSSLIRRFLEKLERVFSQERKYEFRHGAKTKDGLKNVQEITIAKIMVQNLAEFCYQKQYHFF